MQIPLGLFPCLEVDSLTVTLQIWYNEMILEAGKGSIYGENFDGSHTGL